MKTGKFARTLIHAAAAVGFATAGISAAAAQTHNSMPGMSMSAHAKMNMGKKMHHKKAMHHKRAMPHKKQMHHHKK